MPKALTAFLFLVLSVGCLAAQDEALSAFQQRKFNEAVKFWQAASDHGDLQARYRLGLFFYFGRYGEKNTKMAEQLIASAANAGNSRAAYAAYVIGANNPEENNVALLGVLKHAALSGSDAAKTLLALHERSPDEPLMAPPIDEISNDLDGLLPIKFDETFATAKKRSTIFGKAAYQAHCVLCHGPGMMGAPKIGDRQEWKKRLMQGSPAVVENAIKGVGNHPPKGGMYSLTNDELREVVLYMITPSK